MSPCLLQKRQHRTTSRWIPPTECQARVTLALGQTIQSCLVCATARQVVQKLLENPGREALNAAESVLVQVAQAENAAAERAAVFPDGGLRKTGDSLEEDGMVFLQRQPDDLASNP